MNSTLARIRKIQSLLDENEYLKQEQGKQPAWRRVAHFWVLVINSFKKNRGPIRASSLAYTTLLALIPILALVVSVSTSFLQNDKQTINDLVDKLITTIAPQLNLIQQGDAEETAVKRADITQKILGYIEKVNSGALGVSAGFALVFLAVMVLSNVENTFNDIWGVTRGRTWGARFVQYWAAITLGPLFIITAVAFTGAQVKSPTGVPEETKNTVALTNASAPLVPNLSTTNLVQARKTIANDAKPFSEKGFAAKFKAFRKWLGSIGLIGRFILKIVPFIVLTLFVTFVYKMMPATKVKWDAALVGGAVGGCLLQLNNLFSVIYMSKVVGYSKVYGSIGVIPIFLIGLYFSWLIILFGAQVGYAWQNKKAYVQEKQAESINQRGREFVALRIMTFIGQRFYTGEKPPTRFELSDKLGVPTQLASQVLANLCPAKLVVEVAGEESAYAPGRPIDKISVEDILCALRAGQGTELATSDDPTRVLIREEYERVVLAEMHTAGAVTLQSLVLRSQNLPPRVEQDPEPEIKAAVA